MAEATPALGAQLAVYEVRPEVLRRAALLYVGTLAAWTLLLLTESISVTMWLVGFVYLKRLLPNLAMLSSQRVTVFEDGFVVENLLSRSEVLWSRIDAVYVTAEVLAPWSRLVGIGRGMRLSVARGLITLSDASSAFAVLLAKAQSSVAERRAGVMREAFEADKWVWFGPVQLHRQEGLRFREQVTPWDRLAPLTVNLGALSLPDGGRVRLALVPNLALLLDLAEGQGVEVSAARAILC